MITLYVAVIVRARHIGRIKINQIHLLRREIEEIRPQRLIAPSIVKRRLIIDLDLFKKMLFEGKLEVALAIVVARQITRDREHTARLSLKACAEQRREGEGLLMWV
jgi:hypothetical protein